jgi:hypothetical protein
MELSTTGTGHLTLTAAGSGTRRENTTRSIVFGRCLCSKLDASCLTDGMAEPLDSGHKVGTLERWDGLD